MSNNSIWPTDRILACAIAPSQRESESNGNKGLLHIPQSSRITGASPSDSLVSYIGHLLVVGGDLLFYRDAAGVFSSPSRLGNYHSEPEWTREWWQWRGTLHFPKLQHHFFFFFFFFFYTLYFLYYQLKILVFLILFNDLKIYPYFTQIKNYVLFFSKTDLV